MARTISSHLSGVVEHLELEGDLVVTIDSLRVAMEVAGFDAVSDERVRAVGYQLQRAGWLGSVRSKNAWEFLPGSRGGRYGSGDRFIEFRAYVATHAGWPGLLAMESAAVLHGLAQRVPEREVVALPKGALGPKSFARDWRVITTALPSSASTVVSELRVWTLEALLVGVGERPTNYRDIAGLAQWLPEGTQRTDASVVNDLLGGLPLAVRQRTAYLFAAVGDHRTRDHLLSEAGRLQVVWFGPRRQGGTFDSATGVHDTVLLPLLAAGTGA